MPRFRVVVDAFDVFVIEDAKDKQEAEDIALEVIQNSRANWVVSSVEKLEE